VGIAQLHGEGCFSGTGKGLGWGEEFQLSGGFELIDVLVEGIDGIGFPLDRDVVVFLGTGFAEVDAVGGSQFIDEFQNRDGAQLILEDALQFDAEGLLFLNGGDGVSLF
jgi:hypothetical protein